MNKPVELRESPRYTVPEGAIAISPTNIAQLVDISLGGISLRCHDNHTFSDEFCVDILASEYDFFEKQIPVKLVWEKK